MGGMTAAFRWLMAIVTLFSLAGVAVYLNTSEAEAKTVLYVATIPACAMAVGLLATVTLALCFFWVSGAFIH